MGNVPWLCSITRGYSHLIQRGDTELLPHRPQQSDDPPLSKEPEEHLKKTRQLAPICKVLLEGYNINIYMIYTCIHIHIYIYIYIIYIYVLCI